ncbi:MAG: PTS sugar transporter subunit IIC [Hungatella sp.]|nr:PTS sugar transporter subunit IIC [Hungatella sp.]
MDVLQSRIEKVLLPIGTWLGENRYLTILRKAFMAVMPLTITGSIALIIQFFPFIDKIIPADIMMEISNFLGVVSSASLSLAALFLCASIGYYYTKEEGHEALFGAIVGFSSFLIVTPLEMAVEGLEGMLSGVIPMTWLGGQGLFVAIIIGFLSSFLFNKLMKSRYTIKLPDSVPPMVTEPFKVLIPQFLTFIVLAAIRYGISFTAFGDIHTLVFDILQTPLMALGTSLPASIIVVIFIQLMWFMGLHGQNIAGAVMDPIWQAAMIANLTAVQNGGTPQYIFTSQFFTGFIWMQFSSLIIACLIFAKSEQLKAVGKLSIGSACFNISEPIVFGGPVVFNFILLIPWVLSMVVYVIITWASMALGICPLPLGTNIPWTTPPLISGWLITGSPMGAVLQIVNVIVGIFVYLPFVKMYDKQLVEEESRAQS